MFEEILKQDPVPIEIEDLAKLLYQCSVAKHQPKAKEMLRNEPWRIIAKFNLPEGKKTPSTNGKMIGKGFILEAVEDPSRKVIFSSPIIARALEHNTILNYDTFSPRLSVRKIPGKRYGTYKKSSAKWKEPEKPGLRTLEHMFPVDIDSKGPILSARMKELITYSAFGELPPIKKNVFQHGWIKEAKNKEIVKGMSQFLETQIEP